MGRKCIVCGQLFGCQRGDMQYACVTCRLEDECGIKLYFTTSRVHKETCPDCRQGIKRVYKPPINLSAIAAF